MNGSDVRMVERRENLRLSLEPGQPIRIRREGFRQDLQGDLAVELCVGVLPDFPHPTFTDLGRDFVMAESGADVERHRLAVGGLQRISDETEVQIVIDQAEKMISRDLVFETERD